MKNIIALRNQRLNEMEETIMSPRLDEIIIISGRIGLSILENTN